MSSQQSFDFSSLSDVERSLVNVTLKLGDLVDEMPPPHTTKFIAWNDKFYNELRVAVNIYTANTSARIHAKLYAIFQVTMNKTTFEYDVYRRALENVEAQISKTPSAQVFSVLPDEPLALGENSNAEQKKKPKKGNRRSTAPAQPESEKPASSIVSSKKAEKLPNEIPAKLTPTQLVEGLANIANIPSPDFGRLRPDAIVVSTKDKLTIEELNILGVPLFKSKVQCAGCEGTDQPCLFALHQSVVCVLCQIKRCSCSLAPVRGSGQTVTGSQVTRYLIRWHIERAHEAARQGVEFLSGVQPILVPDSVGRAHPGGKKTAEAETGAVQDAEKSTTKGKGRETVDSKGDGVEEMDLNNEAEVGSTRHSGRERSVRFEGPSDPNPAAGSLQKESQPLRRSGRALKPPQQEVTPLVEQRKPTAKPRERRFPSPPIAHDRATYEKIPSVSDEIPPTESSPERPKKSVEALLTGGERPDPPAPTAPFIVPVGPPGRRKMTRISGFSSAAPAAPAAPAASAAPVAPVAPVAPAAPLGEMPARRAAETRHQTYAAAGNQGVTRSVNPTTSRAVTSNQPLTNFGELEAVWTSWSEEVTQQREAEMISAYEAELSTRGEDHAIAMSEVEIQLRHFRLPRITAETQTDNNKTNAEEDTEMTVD
ncbi:hypothetical protein BXZ70DRAFT_1013322 [Cristinia sonorae]|uniref:Uncharacterized protein n=1 Tax=Cristinia sonorae TaxID=1940300 RepID=A0A8K0UDQ9_9AGAR|nr:hypothetical protein BXZ70DRAFT_1013322 [Cristinia sonorae]